MITGLILRLPKLSAFGLVLATTLLIEVIIALALEGGHSDLIVRNVGLFAISVTATMSLLKDNVLAPTS